MRWLVPLIALMPLAALAQPVAAPGVVVEEAIVQADQAATVWISGLEVELAVSTGTVDHVTLNAAAAARIGLSAVPVDNKADLFIGGVQQRVGRHGAGWLAAGNRLQRQQLYWFPGTDVLPLAGTIGPFALPHDRVRVEWQAGSATPYTFALIGNIDRAAYGVADLAGRPFLVGADVRTRRPLPLVTAGLGSDLAETLGGRFVGEPWQEEIMLGISRPVRRLELARPLVIGPFRINAVAVRQGGPRDATVTLAPGQKPPFDAEEDPGTAQVRGRIIKRRNVARYIMLSRTQLEAHGCISLTVAKSVRQFILECAENAPPPVAVPAKSVAVAVALPPGALIGPVLPPEPETLLSLTEPVTVTIEGRPVQLALGDAGREGLRLNGGAAQQAMEDRLRRLSANARAAGHLADASSFGQMADAVRRTIAPNLFGLLDGMSIAKDRGAQIGIGISSIAPKRQLASVEMTVAHAGRQAQAVASWLGILVRSDVKLDNREPFAGRIALAALPGSRFRLNLSASPPATAAPSAELELSIADRSQDQGVMGVASVPGIDPLFVGLELGLGIDEPVVTLALAQDLIRLHGGHHDGPVQSVRMADDRLRQFRPMQLATPLLVGPLRLNRMLVEQVPGLSRRLVAMRWPSRLPWPDMPGIAGLERELRLPPAVLRAAGCHELVIDKPGRAWTLRCSTISSPPAP
jgi:hypothetical protein